MSDTRGELGKALQGKLSQEQLDFLMNEVLAITKGAWAEFSCKKCGQRQKQLAQVPDAKAVSSALIDLMNQAWGRPDVAATSDDEKIVFQRLVKLEDAEDAS